MDTLKPVYRRASELAFSGRFSSQQEIRTQLISEGFSGLAIDQTFSNFLERKAIVAALKGGKRIVPQFSWITK